MRPARRVALSITLGRHLCRQAGSPSYMVLKQIHEADNCKKLSFQQFRQTVFNTCTASHSTAANASIMRSSTYMYLGLTLDTVQVILTSIYLYLLILTYTYLHLLILGGDCSQDQYTYDFHFRTSTLLSQEQCSNI